MPVLIPVKASVKVVRKGKRLPVPVGKPFQFTDEEVKTIHAIMPGALRRRLLKSSLLKRMKTMLKTLISTLKMKTKMKLKAIAAKLKSLLLKHLRSRLQPKSPLLRKLLRLTTTSKDEPFG